MSVGIHECSALLAGCQASVCELVISTDTWITHKVAHQHTHVQAHTVTRTGRYSCMTLWHTDCRHLSYAGHALFDYSQLYMLSGYKWLSSGPPPGTWQLAPLRWPYLLLPLQFVTHPPAQLTSSNDGTARLFANIEMTPVTSTTWCQQEPHLRKPTHTHMHTHTCTHTNKLMQVCMRVCACFGKNFISWNVESCDGALVALTYSFATIQTSIGLPSLRQSIA